MGNGDRSFRAFVAAIIAILYFADLLPGTVGLVLLVVAVVFLLTSMMGFCPLYFPFNLSTKKKERL